MMAALIVSGVLSRNDVRKVEVEVTPPEELFARSPAAFQVEIRNRSSLLPRWLLLVSFSDHAPTLLCPWLPRAGRRSAVVELEFPRRGVHRIAAAHLATLFPLGLFRKGMRQRLDREVVVFPQPDPGPAAVRRSTSAIGETQDSRAGWGHDLHSLRVLRPGDDPRRIHWKQTARTGSLIFMEREAERSRRISVVLGQRGRPGPRQGGRGTAGAAHQPGGGRRARLPAGGLRGRAGDADRARRVRHRAAPAPAHSRDARAAPVGGGDRRPAPRRRGARGALRDASAGVAS